MFWDLEGVYTTAVGYAAGHTLNPSYQEVCTGMTGHNEVVLVVYDPAVVSLQYRRRLQERLLGGKPPVPRRLPTPVQPRGQPLQRVPEKMP